MQAKYGHVYRVTEENISGFQPISEKRGLLRRRIFRIPFISMAVLLSISALPKKGILLLSFMMSSEGKLRRWLKNSVPKAIILPLPIYLHLDRACIMPC